MAQMFEMLYKQEIGNQDGNLLIKRNLILMKWLTDKYIFSFIKFFHKVFSSTVLTLPTQIFDLKYFI